MIKKLGILGVCTLALTAIISCEKDFTDVGTGIVSNTKFDTDFIELEVEITPVDIESVRADNIAIGNLGSYLVGVYNPANGKKNEATIVSQLALPSNLTIENDDDLEDGEILNPPHLDEVILKIPLPATSLDNIEIDDPNSTTGGKLIVPQFNLENELGNLRKPFTLNVFQGNVFLNSLDPNDPSKANSYESNFDYKQVAPALLATDNSFRFLRNTILTDTEKDLKNIDTAFVFERTLINGNKYKDTLKVVNGAAITANPVKIIRLDKAKLKADIFDKYNDSELSSQDLFNDYFKNIIIEAIDNTNEGAILGLNLNTVSNNLRPSIDFIHTSSITKDGVVTDTIQKTDSFFLNGIKNSAYKMTSTVTAAPANSFVIQGAAGSMAEVTILNDTKLNELKANNWLINDASLTFYVDQTISQDTTIVPQRLFLYQNKLNENNTGVPTQLTDSYLEAALYGGNLTNADKKPEKYTFRITDYVSNLLAGEEGTTNDPLVLKVFNNPTDSPVINNAFDINVKTYNWDPRAVTLVDGNASNETNKAVLKISYSEKK